MLSEPTVNNHTILLDNTIVGSIGKFVMEADAEITYWIDGKYWGHGIASRVLKTFLSKEALRPVYGRVAFDNIASQRVLVKCGFRRVGWDKVFANARLMEIGENIYKQA